MDKIYVFSLIAAALLMLSGCSSGTESGKIKIVTTLFPLYEFAKEVGGDRVEVTLLLPPGVDAHSFEPKPQDIITLNNADLFVYVGAGMEPWADDILAGLDNKDLSIIDASSVSELISSSHDEHEENEHEEGHEDEEEHEHGEFDPHLWLDFTNDQKIVSKISGALSDIDPSGKEYYSSNAERYSSRLAILDSIYISSLSKCNKSEIVTGGHNAFGYLAHRYNITIISVYGLSPNSEPSAQKVKEITDTIREHGIKYIFFEKMVNSRMAEMLAKETGASMLILNPGHNVAKDDIAKNVTFMWMMTNNLNDLVAGLECEN